MKVTQSITFHHEIEGRHYNLVFPVPAPLAECYNVVASVAAEFMKKIEEENAKAAAAEQPVSEEVAPTEAE